MSVTDLYSCKEGAGYAWPIDVARVSVGTFIEITLVVIEDIIQTDIQL